MATRDETEGDVFDRALAGMFAAEGASKGAQRALNTVRGRKGARGTDREASMMRLYSQELNRVAVLLEAAAHEVDVVVKRR